jgi:hypothetical protein
MSLELSVATQVLLTADCWNPSLLIFNPSLAENINPA